MDFVERNKDEDKTITIDQPIGQPTKSYQSQGVQTEPQPQQSQKQTALANVPPTKLPTLKKKTNFDSSSTAARATSPTGSTSSEKQKQRGRKVKDIPGFSGKLNVNHSLSIMFYYLALSLSPSPSTYNNMGIVLSSVSTSVLQVSPEGETSVLTGTNLARIYYTAGLQMDPNHPHLLTNLGSLFKDQGNLEEAIR